MENKELLEQIVARVAQKLAEAGETVTASGGTPQPAVDWQLPGLLILTQEHGCHCHEVLESSRIRECYQTSCALLQDYQVDLDQVEVVVLFNLTTDAMCKIASGITDTPYTSLVAKALLMGKKLFVPVEEVELSRYPVRKPGSFQCMLQTKLDRLVSWGLRICPLRPQRERRSARLRQEELQRTRRQRRADLAALSTMAAARLSRRRR